MRVNQPFVQSIVYEILALPPPMLIRKCLGINNTRRRSISSGIHSSRFLPQRLLQLIEKGIIKPMLSERSIGRAHFEIRFTLLMKQDRYFRWTCIGAI